MDHMLSIRSPRPAELIACRMLLPETASHSARRYLIACVSEPPYFLGAASWLRVPKGGEALRLSVIYTCRRRGIGSKLLEAVADDIRATGGSELVGWCDAISEENAPKFLSARDFVRTERVTKVEAEADQFADYCQAFRDRLRIKGRVPPGIRTVSLRDIAKSTIADACKRYLIDEPETRQDLLEHKLETGVFDDSPVMFSGDELVGFLLARLDGKCAHVAARVVLPRFRGGWANALLMAALADLRFFRPERIVSFEWREQGVDTAKLVARFPHRIVALRDCYVRSLYV